MFSRLDPEPQSVLFVKRCLNCQVAFGFQILVARVSMRILSQEIFLKENKNNTSWNHIKMYKLKTRDSSLVYQEEWQHLYVEMQKRRDCVLSVTMYVSIPSKSRMWHEDHAYSQCRGQTSRRTRRFCC